MTAKTETNNCGICGANALEGLFRHGDDMVCCNCKYGEPMRAFTAGVGGIFSVPTQCSSRPQPISLDFYDNRGGRR